jgi:ubiquitin-conjugating enzyme E2 G1
MPPSKPPTSAVAAAVLLARQLKEMQTGNDIPGISVGLVNDSNIFEWEVMLMINDDCKYYGGMCSFHLLPSPSDPFAGSNTTNVEPQVETSVLV